MDRDPNPPKPCRTGNKCSFKHRHLHLQGQKIQEGLHRVTVPNVAEKKGLLVSEEIVSFCMQERKKTIYMSNK